jgi:hypothetical protein
MDKQDSQKRMLAVLEERYESATGMERESTLFRIQKIRKALAQPYNDYITTSRIVTVDKIKNKLFVDKNLQKGYRKLMEADPSLAEMLTGLCDFIDKKDMLLSKEVSKGDSTGTVSIFKRVAGTVILDLLDVSIDPLYEPQRIDFYADSRKKASMALGSLSVSIELENNADIEMLLVAKNEVYLGVLYLPCEFFITRHEDIVTLDFRNYNTIETKVTFRSEIKLVRKNAEICCIYERGHGLENFHPVGLAYCEVCKGMLSLISYNFRCFRCNVTCHHGCSPYLFFKCKNGPQIEDKGPKKNYDIPHAFSQVSSSGVRFCSHCGERILQSSNDSFSCNVCRENYHTKCKEFVFNSCGIDLELRKTLSEFIPPAFEEVCMAQVKISDFELKRVLGRGNFGKVVLAKNRESGDLVALKILKKERIVNTNDIFYIELERKVLSKISSLDNRFVMRLLYAFQDSFNVFLCAEYLAGGDLFHHAVEQDFTHGQIVLYAAEMALALEFLHSKNIIYRDFKLDNVMLTTDGHIKLVDFGLCKEGMGPYDITYTYCGTPDGIAPEIIKREGYTKDVDWWSYGVVLYELYEKHPPFFGLNNRETANLILTTPPVFVLAIEPTARQFLAALLQKDPKKRLGYGEADAKEVKAHRYFEGVDWCDAENGRLRHKFAPGDGISNFDSAFTDEVVIITPTASFNKYDEYLRNFPWS